MKNVLLSIKLDTEEEYINSQVEWAKCLFVLPTNLLINIQFWCATLRFCTPYLIDCPTDGHYRIHLDEGCDTEGQTIENLKIVRGGNLADAIITGTIASEAR